MPGSSERLLDCRSWEDGHCISAISVRSEGVRKRCCGEGLLPVEKPGLVGGVKVKKSGGRPTDSMEVCVCWLPKRTMSSYGELPRMLRWSRSLVGGESQLEKEQLDADDA